MTESSIKKRNFGPSESTEVMTYDELEKLVKKFGVRFIIRNYRLTNDLMMAISHNKFSCLCDEDDIDIDEIRSYQSKFDK